MGVIADLQTQLAKLLRGRVCFMGLGNLDYGDDGAGVRVAEELVYAGIPGVVVAETAPERSLAFINGSFDHLVFIDSVEFGGEPGSVVLLNAKQMDARFPQVSTHKIALGTLAKLVESGGRRTKAWLLGVQPASLQVGRQLTPVVQTTVEALADLLRSLTPNAREAHV